MATRATGTVLQGTISIIIHFENTFKTQSFTLDQFRNKYGGKYIYKI